MKHRNQETLDNDSSEDWQLHTSDETPYLVANKLLARPPRLLAKYEKNGLSSTQEKYSKTVSFKPKFSFVPLKSCIGDTDDNIVSHKCFITQKTIPIMPSQDDDNNYDECLNYCVNSVINPPQIIGESNKSVATSPHEDLTPKSSKEKQYSEYLFENNQGFTSRSKSSVRPILRRGCTDSSLAISNLPRTTEECSPKKVSFAMTKTIYKIYKK